MLRLILISVITSITFSGCALLTPTKQYIVKKQVEYISLPKEYIDLTTLHLVKLPDREKYINADPYERDRMNTKLILKLYKNIGKYRARLSMISEYEKGVRKINAEKNEFNFNSVKKYLKKSVKE